MHRAGGPALDQFDRLGAIIKWVEQNQPPTQIDSTGRAFPGVTRPLCPYPQVARYRGAGSIDDAANFSCKAP